MISSVAPPSFAEKPRHRYLRAPSSFSPLSWKQRTRCLPEELIFDSKLTTYANLRELSRMGIQLITARRRSKKLLEQIARTPMPARRCVTLESVSHACRTPRILDQQIRLKAHGSPLGQLVIADLGHGQPTLLLTNRLTRSAPYLIDRYAQRMLIENNIEDETNAAIPSLGEKRLRLLFGQPHAGTPTERGVK